LNSSHNLIMRPISSALANHKTASEDSQSILSVTDIYNPVSLPKQISELDGFRGLAILLVMIGHFFAVCKIQILAMHPLLGLIIFKMYSQGGHGVDLFFVLSGFLITGILLDAKGKKSYFKNFYMRRFLRIFPLYYGVLFVCLVVLPAVWPFFRELSSDILKNQKWLWLYAVNVPPFSHLTFFDRSMNFVHFWSLAVEEHFYLVWPLAVFIFNRRRLMIFAGVVILLAIALRSVLMTAGADPWTVESFTLCRIDALAIGGVIAALMRSKYDRTITSLAKPGAIVFGIICLVIMSRRSGQNPNDLDSTCFAIFAGALMILAFADNAKTRWRRFLNNRFMRFSGKISYGLYVYHFLFLGALAQLLSPRWLSDKMHSNALAVIVFVSFVASVSYIVAIMSWNIYEKPILKFKRYFE
jgi:peptidoglycan/LPS O-acetylase OafA/YrhL